MIKISEYFSLLLLMISTQRGMHLVQIIMKFFLNVNLTYMELANGLLPQSAQVVMSVKGA